MMIKRLFSVDKCFTNVQTDV
ncbi:hypothetical protein BsWGS_24420 [Bradybaena similaris]